jgi:hypothetical protein
MSALDKVLKLAGPQQQAPEDDPAGELVLAARTCLTELRAYLADPGGDDDEDDGGGDSHSSHGTYKALVKKGMDPKRAASMCARADKRVKAAAQAEAALLALSELAVPEHDWVEATAYDYLGAVALGAGDRGIAYADPGYLGRQRFRLDTEENIRLSLAYASQAEHTAGYAPAQLADVRARIASAARSAGIALSTDEDKIAAGVLLGLSVLTAEDRRKPGAHTLGDSEDYPIPDRAHLTAAIARYKQGKFAGHKPEEVAAHIRTEAKRLGVSVDLAGSGLEEAAELVALAKKAPVDGGGIIMNHAPFTGTHAHGHFQSQVHDHPHQHFGDNSHEGGPAHRPGSKPGGRAGW